MGNRRLYVGNIPWDTTEQDLRNRFSEYRITSVRVITDRETGKPRGFAFVELATEHEARTAIEQLDGTDFGGRTLRVNEAAERERGGGQNRRRKEDGDYGWRK